MNTRRDQFARALKRLGGDKELFEELAAFFIEDAPELLQVIRAGLAAGSAQQVQRAAHSLQSLVANFDAERAMAITHGMEQMCDKGELPSLVPALVDLDLEVQSLCAALRGFAAKSSSVSSSANFP